VADRLAQAFILAGGDVTRIVNDGFPMGDSQHSQIAPRRKSSSAR
jgi:hypothetical protein